jgi:hypothetical protein
MRQKWFCHNKIQFCLTKFNFVKILIISVCRLLLRNLNQTNLNTKMNYLIRNIILCTKMVFVYKSDFYLQKWVLSWQNLLLFLFYYLEHQFYKKKKKKKSILVFCYNFVISKSFLLNKIHFCAHKIWFCVQNYKESYLAPRT